MKTKQNKVFTLLALCFIGSALAQSDSAWEPRLKDKKAVRDAIATLEKARDLPPSDPFFTPLKISRYEHSFLVSPFMVVLRDLEESVPNPPVVQAHAWPTKDYDLPLWLNWWKTYAKNYQGEGPIPSPDPDSIWNRNQKTRGEREMKHIIARVQSLRESEVSANGDVEVTPSEENDDLARKTPMNGLPKVSRADEVDTSGKPWNPIFIGLALSLVAGSLVWVFIKKRGAR